jgi:hypothetical protein
MRITIGILLYAIGVLPLYSQRIMHTELLGKPTDKSIAIQLVFTDTAEARIQYGVSKGNYTNETSWQKALPDQSVVFSITQLQTNTRYYYRVQYRSNQNSTSNTLPERTFATQPPASQPFVFTVQADPHCDEQSDTALYRICLNNQLADSPDFMVDLGDVVMSDKLKNSSGKITRDTINKRTHYMRSFYETACHSVPLFLALGNHEGESGWLNNNTAENIAIWNTLERKKYFLNPTPDGFYTGDTTQYPFVGQRGAYYSWQWGNALFIVLDPYWHTKPKPDSLNGWRWTLGKAQYDWLRRTLESSTAPFKFVFAHQLVGGDPDGRGGVEFADKYEWGGKNLNGSEGFAQNRAGWYKPIKALLAEHRVSIFFHGHDHFFAKQDKECLVYQLTPQPSHPNFSNAGQADDYGYFAGQILPNAGHLRVTVSPSDTKVEYVRAYIPANETANRKNRDVAATYTIGLKNCYDSLTTSVPVLWNSAYADELIYPNPFSNEATIRFTLSTPQRLSLVIVDTRGNRVRHLLNSTTVDTGDFTIVWDGKDDNGQALPSGQYSYAVQNTVTGDKVSQGIMNLIR